MNILLTGNEPRQQRLFLELGKKANVVGVVDFDDIDPITKYCAAALSFAWPKSEWWGNYQLHGLVSKRRQRVLRRQALLVQRPIDCIVMWGSWFSPRVVVGSKSVPYVTYIDQSRSLARLPGEEPATLVRRRRSHRNQAETYENAAVVLCMSEWARRQTLDAHDIPEEKVITVGWGPCGIDLEGSTLDDSRREHLVLHVSNDFHRKGVDFLIETAAEVRKKLPGTRFVVIGRDGKSVSTPQSRDVEFLGPIYDKDKLEDYFRRASVFFLPHRFDRSPHVLVEALSAGLPIVSSRQGGAIELVEGTGVGFLHEIGDTKGYAESICNLLSDNPLWTECSKRAVDLQRSYYNWSAIADRILKQIAKHTTTSV